MAYSQNSIGDEVCFFLRHDTVRKSIQVSYDGAFSVIRPDVNGNDDYVFINHIKAAMILPSYLQLPSPSYQHRPLSLPTFDFRGRRLASIGYRGQPITVTGIYNTSCRYTFNRATV